MGSRSFRVEPSNDDELLAVERFGFTPEATVSWRIGRVDRLRDDALKAELAGVFQNELAVAGVVAIELKAGLDCHQGLKQRFALDKRQPRDVTTVKMQKIESVKDELHVALAVGRRLGLREARQSRLVDAAKLAVDIGCLYVQVREGGNGAWIFGGPVQARSGQELHAAVIDARGHTVAVELDLMDPLRPRRGLLNRPGKLGRDELRKGHVAARPTGFDGLRGRTLGDTRHAGNSIRLGG